MSITVEKTVNAVVDASATASISFTGLPTTGATILVEASCVETTGSNSTMTVSDNQGGTSYTKDFDTVNAVSGHATTHAAVFRRSNISAPSGTFTVTASCGTSGSYWTIGAISVLNLANAAPVASSTNSAGNTTPSTGTSGDSTQASTIALAVACTEGNASVANEGFADPATFAGTATGNTAVSVEVSQNSSLHAAGEGSYKIETAQGTVSASWGAIQSAGSWSASLAVYAESVATADTLMGQAWM